MFEVNSTRLTSSTVRTLSRIKALKLDDEADASLFMMLSINSFVLLIL